MNVRLLPALAAALLLWNCASGDSPPAESAAGNPQHDSPAVAEEHVAGGHEADDHASAPGEEDLLHRTDPHGVYGAGITLGEASPLAAILAEPAAFEGRTVRVSGEVAEVCPMRGCWIELTDPASGQTMRVKVKDGDIVFPLSAKGESIEVEGKVEKIELDEEQARNFRKHEAEEKGEEFDPATVTGPQVIWRIWGLGAEI